MKIAIITEEGTLHIHNVNLINDDEEAIEEYLFETKGYDSNSINWGVIEDEVEVFNNGTMKTLNLEDLSQSI